MCVTFTRFRVPKLNGKCARARSKDTIFHIAWYCTFAHNVHIRHSLSHSLPFTWGAYQRFASGLCTVHLCIFIHVQIWKKRARNLYYINASACSTMSCYSNAVLLACSQLLCMLSRSLDLSRCVFGCVRRWRVQPFSTIFAITKLRLLTPLNQLKLMSSNVVALVYVNSYSFNFPLLQPLSFHFSVIAERYSKSNERNIFKATHHSACGSHIFIH